MPEILNIGNVIAQATAEGVRLDVDPEGDLTDLISRIAPTGENANGKFLQIGNAQVCWGNNVIPYGATSGTWTFPAEFSGQPVVVPVPRRGSSPGTFTLRVGGLLTSTQVGLERSGGDISVDAIAIGTWR